MSWIYIADIRELEAETEFQRALCSVSPQRRDRALRQGTRRAQLHSLSAGLLLQQAWQDSNGGRAELTLVYGEQGKPYAQVGERREQDFYFSLSHSGDFVICAVSDDEIGADIQQVKAVKGRVAERFFCQSEYEMIQEMKTPEAKAEMFCRLWCIKESYLKYTGRGLTQKLDSFLIKPDENDRMALFDLTGQRIPVVLEEDNRVPGYKIAVCEGRNLDSSSHSPLLPALKLGV